LAYDVNTELGNEPSKSCFAPDATAESGDYSSVSVLAIASLLLGLASPLCIFGTLLLVIPLAGMAVSLAALGRIAASGGMLAGRPAAVLGLVISIGTGTAVTSHALAIRQLRVDQAAEIGKEWIKAMLSGDTQRAFLLAYGDLPPNSDQPQDFGPEGSPYHRFMQWSTVRALSSAGKGADIQFVETVRFGNQGRGECYVRQRFLVIPQGSTGAGNGARGRPINVLLQLHRMKALGASYMTWLAMPIEETELPAG
jgi:hypothetical protein